MSPHSRSKEMLALDYTRFLLAPQSVSERRVMEDNGPLGEVLSVINYVRASSTQKEYLYQA